MRSTLFYVPHELAGYPMFGFGILLCLLGVGMVGYVLWALFKQESSAQILGTLPVFGIAAAIIIFVFPSVEQSWPDGTPIGLPVRGYGVLVVLGLAAGVGITCLRARQLGVTTDHVVGIGFWMMLAGVLGARVFYVVQKWSEFKSLAEVFQFTEGGLVIYGGVIGGLLAGVAFCQLNKLKIPAMADLIAPGFLLGLAFGRIGCLLHGCCFGGVCQASLPTMQFPHGSGPYQAQLMRGELLGLQLDQKTGVVESVSPDTLASQQDIQVGSLIEGIYPDPLPPNPQVDNPALPPKLQATAVVNGTPYRFSHAQLPQQSLAVHPSQLYSSFNALLLCCLLWFWQPIPKHDGVVFLGGIALYSVSRFLLEGIRSDEGGQFGTPFSISQLVSAGLLVLSAIALVWLMRQAETRIWNWKAASST